MGSKKNPAARRAQRNARRTTRKQKEARSTTASRTTRGRSLFDLNPPGAFYQEWDTPNGSDTNLLGTVAAAYGADSDEAAATRLILEYRGIYGPHIPIAAAAHLDLIVRDSDLAAALTRSLGSTADDVRDSLHSLHAQGMLLIADDGSLWLTVPPGTPYSAAGGQWAFVEQKAAAPAG